MARAASRSSSCKRPSAAARRTRCWRSITWPRASVPLGDLAGIPALLDQAGLMDVPQARSRCSTAPPTLPASRGSTASRRSGRSGANWPGSSAGRKASRWCKEADANGTSPGKDVLCTLLSRFAPCVVLIDELVAYIRQFVGEPAAQRRHLRQQPSFVQSLTEAAKLVPNAVVLASLPESDSRGR